MPKFIRKHPFRSLTIVGVVFIGLAVLIQLTKGSNDIAKWVLNFVNDWAPALSATAAVTLIITFIWNIRENRRDKAKSFLQEWVINVNKRLINSYSIAPDSRERLDALTDMGLAIRRFAGVLGDEPSKLMDEIINNLLGMINAIDNNDSDKYRGFAVNAIDLVKSFEHIIFE